MMKSKTKRENEKNSAVETAFPVEEYALLVEGLDASDIETACFQDGAASGGVPPGWNCEALSEALAKRAPTLGPKALEAEWVVWPDGPSGGFDEQSACVIIARGRELSALGVADGETLDVHMDMEPGEGDLVIAELEGFGKFLRKLRFVGGAPLLCSQHVERPAILLDQHDLTRVRVVTRRGLLG